MCDFCICASKILAYLFTWFKFNKESSKELFLLLYILYICYCKKLSNICNRKTFNLKILKTSLNYIKLKFLAITVHIMFGGEIAVHMVEVL